MNSLVVLAVLAVTVVQAKPQAAVGPNVGATQAAVPQFQNNFPGFFLAPQGGIPTPLVQFQSPFLAQTPGIVGQAPTMQQVIPITSYVVRPLSEAEQNALAHQEFQRIWEAQATRNLAIPQLKAAVSAKAASSTSAASPSETAQPMNAAADPVSAPMNSNSFQQFPGTV